MARSEASFTPFGLSLSGRRRQVGGRILREGEIMVKRLVRFGLRFQSPSISDDKQSYRCQAQLTWVALPGL